MEQKTHIERNTVQETLVIPLYGRKLCTEQFPRLFRDEKAVELIGRIDYDFSALAAKSNSFTHRFGALEVAMRENDLKDPSVPGAFRLLSKIADGFMKMRIIRMDFTV